MKNSSLGTKILMAVVCLVVLSYFGLQAYRYFNDPISTAVAYRYQVEDSANVTGWVVRNEQVLSDSVDGLLSLSRKEGEKVSKGGEIARVYADQASLDRQTQIDQLSAQIEQLQYAQEASSGSDVSLKLDTQITDGILSLRSNLAADRLDAVDDDAESLRSLVLKRDYTYSDTQDLGTQLTDLQSQLAALRSQAAASIKTVTAPVSGIYSAVVDGYETVLTPDFLTDLTPSKLSGIAADSAVSSGLGKLILGDVWYYAATMPASDAERLSVGDGVTLHFAKGDDREFRMSVKSVSKTENGRVAVVFYSRAYLPELTLLRQQSADIVRNTYSGIRVPEKALCVDESGQTGLYCVVGMVARFKPVTVVYTGENFALVKAASETERALLRAGDEVIITSGTLYDGMVVQ